MEEHEATRQGGPPLVTSLVNPFGEEQQPHALLAAHPAAERLLSAALSRHLATGRAPLPFILIGPTGCGKTRLIQSAAGASGHQVVSLLNIRTGSTPAHLEEAIAAQAPEWPCLLHIDGAGSGSFGAAAAFLRDRKAIAYLRDGLKISLNLQDLPVVIEVHPLQLLEVQAIRSLLGGRVHHLLLHLPSPDQAIALLHQPGSPLMEFKQRMEEAGLEPSFDESFLNRLVEGPEFQEWGFHGIAQKLELLELEFFGDQGACLG